MNAYDVVVHAATSAGVCAAVAAAQSGATVALVEPGRHLGGMTSGGLGYTDVGDVRVLGGMAARLREEIGAYYGVAPGTYAGPEPHVAEAIFTRWLERAGVTVLLRHTLASVDVRDGRIEAITSTGGDAVRGGAFVDASYEGDLLALAGVVYSVCSVGQLLRIGEYGGGRRRRSDGVGPLLVALAEVAGRLRKS